MTVSKLIKSNDNHPLLKRHGVHSVGIILYIFFMLMHAGCTSSKDKPLNDSLFNAAEAQDTLPAVKASPDRLTGRWLRPDGGYIMEIRSTSADGKLDVGYFNPNPIHVGRAEWVEKEGKYFVLVELQDVNYPGSTYGLEYIVGQDRLTGTYFQAVEKSTFDVQFVRDK